MAQMSGHWLQDKAALRATRLVSSLLTLCSYGLSNSLRIGSWLLKVCGVSEVLALPVIVSNPS